MRWIDINFRNVNKDILQDWLLYREEDLCSLNNANDRNHMLHFDEVCEKILNSIPKQNRDFVKKQLNTLDDNFMDYVGYWNEKYYRNGFCDGVELINGCLK